MGKNPKGIKNPLLITGEKPHGVPGRRNGKLEKGFIS